MVTCSRRCQFRWLKFKSHNSRLCYGPLPIWICHTSIDIHGGGHFENNAESYTWTVQIFEWWCYRRHNAWKLIKPHEDPERWAHFCVVCHHFLAFYSLRIILSMFLFTNTLWETERENPKRVKPHCIALQLALYVHIHVETTTLYMAILFCNSAPFKILPQTVV